MFATRTAYLTGKQQLEKKNTGGRTREGEIFVYMFICELQSSVLETIDSVCSFLMFFCRLGSRMIVQEGDHR